MASMNTKSSAYYQREYRKRLREAGFVKKEVWILPDNAKRLAAYERMLREPYNGGEQLAAGLIDKRGDNKMNEHLKRWTTDSLLEALAQEDLVTSKRASIELIGGVEPALHIVMHEFGDLPIYLTVAGDQLIVEAVLWAIDDVVDIHRFNDTVLRTHKYFPLSTISLDSTAGGQDYYHMFGALSATSILANVVLEIEVLASNVIQATEAYGEFLNIALEAEG